MKVTSLPFELDRDEIRGSGASARAVHGTLHVQATELIIEYFLDNAAGSGQPPHVVRIPLRNVTEVAMTGGAVKSPRLLIETSDDAVMSAVPWAAGAQCVLRFRRADGQRLRELIEEIEVRLAEVAAEDRER